MSEAAVILYANDPLPSHIPPALRRQADRSSETVGLHRLSRALLRLAVEDSS